MSYNTLADASVYFQSRLYSKAWFDADLTTRQQALDTACRAINVLKFCGAKYNASQENEFPRNYQTGEAAGSVPVTIKYAEAEIAFGLITGQTVSELKDAQRIKRESWSKTSVEYNSSDIPDYLLAGINSELAWSYLWPYLTNTGLVTISKV